MQPEEQNMSKILFNIWFIFCLILGILDKEPYIVPMFLFAIFIVNIHWIVKAIYYRIMIFNKPGMAINTKTNEWIITGNERKFQKMLRFWREHFEE
jgi:hypothetical protein